ncbi:hypothetical protein ACH4UM_33965 [Streptomyces sp. NPDC020801]|uniref:hypothetical protein n=1 Tax=unclassified Streptomyces TaxID=2593676 RepID=UPI0037B27EAD
MPPKKREENRPATGAVPSSAGPKMLAGADQDAIKEMIAHLKWVFKSGQEWMSASEFIDIELAGNRRLPAQQMIDVLAAGRVIEQPEEPFHYVDEYKISKERCEEFFRKEGLEEVYLAVSARHSSVARPAPLDSSGVDRGLAGEGADRAGAASAMSAGADRTAADRMVAYLEAALEHGRGVMSTMDLIGVMQTDADRALVKNMIPILEESGVINPAEGNDADKFIVSQEVFAQFCRENGLKEFSQSYVRPAPMAAPQPAVPGGGVAGPAGSSAPRSYPVDAPALVRRGANRLHSDHPVIQRLREERNAQPIGNGGQIHTAADLHSSQEISVAEAAGMRVPRIGSSDGTTPAHTPRPALVRPPWHPGGRGRSAGG